MGGCFLRWTAVLSLAPISQVFTVLTGTWRSNTPAHEAISWDFLMAKAVRVRDLQGKTT